MKIAVILTPCEEGGFSAHVPTLSGCFGEGETVEEALDDIRQAIELHVEAAEDDLVVEDDELVFELVWHASRSDPDTARLGSGAESAPNSPQAPLEPDQGIDRTEQSPAIQPEAGQSPPRRRLLRLALENEGPPG